MAGGQNAAILSGGLLNASPALPEVVCHRDPKACQCRADIRLSPAVEQLARDIISPQDSVPHRSTPVFAC